MEEIMKQFGLLSLHRAIQNGKIFKQHNLLKFANTAVRTAFPAPPDTKDAYGNVVIGLSKTEAKAFWTKVANNDASSIEVAHKLNEEWLRVKGELILS